MKLKKINQLKNCLMTFREVEVFKFYMGNGEYSSVLALPERDYDPFDRISLVLSELSLMGRDLTSCSVEYSPVLGKRLFKIGTRATKDNTSNIDADLVQFFLDELKFRHDRAIKEQEMNKDIPEE